MTMKKHSPNHLRKGKSGEWANVLTKRQKRTIHKIAGSLLKFLNYPDEDCYVPEFLPSLPKNIKVKDIEKILNDSNRAVVFIRRKNKLKNIIFNY